MELRKGYKQTELGVIPEDWDVKELREIGKFKNGINKGSEDFGFGYPFVNLMDVFGKSSINGSENFGLINSNDIERKLYDLKKGDVLFIRSSVKPSGVGLTCVIENNLQDIVFSGFIIRYRDDNFLDVGFKKYCFNNDRFRNNLIGSSTVSANTNINQEALKKLQIPLPPTKAEQTAIATALSDMDALISSQEQLIQKKKAIKQGAMQQLLKPKEGWVVKKLGEFLLAVIDNRGKTPPFQNNSDIELLETNAISFTLKYPDYSKVTKYVNALVYKNWFRGHPKQNDILISTVGEYSGASAIMENERGTIAQNLVALRFNQNLINCDFIFYWFRSRLFDNQLKQVMMNQAQPSLRVPWLLNFSIAFPEKLELQKSIGNILTDMDTEIQTLEQNLSKYQQFKQGMMQELLTGKTRLI